MAYIRFLNSKKLIPCKVIPGGKHVVSLSFSKKTKVNTSGFDLFLDPDGKINIGGNTYHEFRTVYRNDDMTAEFHGYQLSDDGSVYFAAGKDPETSAEPTEEMLTEQERQQRISAINREIDDKKKRLSETDYIIVKQCEYALAGKDCKGYDLERVHCQRQTLRDEINDLRQELKSLDEERRE